MTPADVLEQATDLLRQGVELLRTTYTMKSDFAHAAQMWVLAAEHLAEELDVAEARLRTQP